MIEDSNLLPTVITEDLHDSLMNAMKEMSGSMFRIESEKELQKEIVDSMKEKHNIPKNYFKKLCKIFHAQSLAEEMQQEEEFFEFAQAILEFKN